jgi:acyl-CoA synthetase (NDP forming)
MTPTANLDRFMSPRSVAVIGASRKIGKGSFSLIENMLAFGYGGEIYPVNPMADEILGFRSYRAVREIGKPVDLAVVSTPREQVPGIIEECASVGIEAAIIVPQGFADADEAGKEFQRELSRIAQQRGIRLMGPNTLGTLNAFSGFTSSFMPLRREKVPVGVICQSGIFLVGSPLFTGMVGKGIDIGNGCDLDFADALDYFGQDDDIKVIFMHIEGLDHGRRLLDVARRVCPQKPVIAFKTARTDAGARTATSHSGAMAGAYNIFRSALQQAGVMVISDPAEIVDLTKAMLYLHPMQGNRVGIVTFTGAGGIILIDALTTFGLKLAVLSPQTVSRVAALSPSWMTIQNPLDIWPALMMHGMDRVYADALRSVLEDPEVDGVICIAIAPELPDQAYLDATGAIARVASACPEKPVAAWLYGANQACVSRNLEKSRTVISVPTLPRAASVLKALYRRHLFLHQTAPLSHGQMPR